MPQALPEHGRDLFVKEINPGPDAMARLDAYAALLARWQKRINLVGASTLQDVWSRHFLDSAQLYRYLPSSAETLTDIGSGGGFPGLILAVLLTSKGRPTVTLVESNSRKAAFLREAARICKVRAEILNARIENADLIPADVVTARACAPLSKLLPLVHRSMRPNGVALLLKGAHWRNELTAANKEWRIQMEEIPSLTNSSGVVLKLEGFNPN